jgi:hypothetical protein
MVATARLDCEECKKKGEAGKKVEKAVEVEEAPV